MFLQLVVVKDVKFFQLKTLLKATVLETVAFLFFILCDFKSVSLRRCETNKPPAMRVRIEGYTVITKNTSKTSYNIGVQANCKTKGVKTMAQKAHSLSHTKWMCKYHIVFTPKYRRKIIYNQYRSSLGEIFS